MGAGRPGRRKPLLRFRIVIMIKSSLDTPQVKNWLQKAGIDSYICSQCSGLHLSGLQALEGVVDSRLFVEDWGLLLSTEFQVRPTALMGLSGEMGVLNATYPALKIFLDIVDEAVPQLVAGATVLTGAGLSEEQFELFIATTRQAVGELGEELAHMDCLLPEDGEAPGPAPQVH